MLMDAGEKLRYAVLRNIKQHLGVTRLNGMVVWTNRNPRS